MKFTPNKMRLSSGAFFIAVIAASCAPVQTTPVQSTSEAPTGAPERLTESSVDGSPKYGLPIIYADDDGLGFVDRCGETFDYKDVEYHALDSYLTPKGFSKNFSDTHEPATVLLRWLPSDILRVSPELADYNARSVASVGGLHWCTGTLLDMPVEGDEAPENSAYVLTAAHCFTNDYVPFKRSGDYLPAAQVARHMEAVFGYQIDWASQEVPNDLPFYQIDRLVEDGFALNPELDYAIVRLIGEEGATDLADRARDNGIPIADANPREDERIVIIQHPGGQPKKVDAGTVDDVTAVRMAYKDVDTRRGSSGSGVLMENDAGAQIVGVHVTGGCEFGIGNGATPIEAIRRVSGLL